MRKGAGPVGEYRVLSCVAHVALCVRLVSFSSSSRIVITVTVFKEAYEVGGEDGHFVVGLVVFFVVMQKDLSVGSSSTWSSSNLSLISYRCRLSSSSSSSVFLWQLVPTWWVLVGHGDRCVDRMDLQHCRGAEL